MDGSQIEMLRFDLKYVLDCLPSQLSIFSYTQLLKETTVHVFFISI